MTALYWNVEHDWRENARHGSLSNRLKNHTTIKNHIRSIEVLATKWFLNGNRWSICDEIEYLL